jgi:CheY-like chemotaxis protein
MRRVLVVDDEPSMREMLGIMLTKEGYDVITADSRATAAKALARGPVMVMRRPPARRRRHGDPEARQAAAPDGGGGDDGLRLHGIGGGGHSRGP